MNNINIFVKSLVFVYVSCFWKKYVKNIFNILVRNMINLSKSNNLINRGFNYFFNEFFYLFLATIFCLHFILLLFLVQSESYLLPLILLFLWYIKYKIKTFYFS